MNNETSRKFGENLRRLRKRKGLSQEELAERSASHHNYISFLERGQRSATVPKVIQIANALGCKASELFRGLQK